MKKTEKGFIVPLLIIVIGLLVLGGGAYIYTHNKESYKESDTKDVQKTETGTQTTSTTSTTVTTVVNQGNNPKSTAALLSYTIQKPQLYIYGKGLSAVKIYDWPTGTGVYSSSFLVNATLQSTSADGTQTWLWDTSKGSYGDGPGILATSIDIQAYDTQSTLVGKMSIGHGASDLNDLLFVQPQNTVPLSTYSNAEYGFSFEYPNNVNVTLLNYNPPHGTTLVLPNNNYIAKDGNIFYADGAPFMKFSIFQKASSDLAAYVANDVRQGQAVNATLGANDAVKITSSFATINGVSAYKVRYEYPAVSTINPYATPLNRLWIQNASNVYLFYYSDNQPDLVNAVLASFKFK